MFLEPMLYIYYSLQFQKNTTGVKALINSGSEVNVMTPVYALKLGLNIYPSDVGAQKIVGSILKIFEIILGSFQIDDKLGRTQFFQNIFLLTDNNMKVVLGMPFLTFSNVDI